MSKEDGGINSRKLWFSVGTSLAIVATALFIPAAVLSEVIMGLISVLAIYNGSNTATKWVATRHLSRNPAPVKSSKKTKRDEEHLGE